MKIFKFMSLAVTAVALSFAFYGCNDDVDYPDNPTGGSGVHVTLPKSIEVIKGQDCTFPLAAGDDVAVTDLVYLENLQGVFYECPITSVVPAAASSDSEGTGHFSFTLPKKFVDGSYRVYIKRGDERKLCGTVSIAVIEKPISINEGTTVYGRISTEEGPVAGVVVSDGVETTVTDADGVYQLASTKVKGYVFMSVPSGYEPEQLGVLPVMYAKLKGGPNEPESAHFRLTKVDQSNYKMLVFGDMHLANRTDDLKQFSEFTDDVKDYMRQNPEARYYALTLGDMSWDLYWLSRKYDLTNYLDDINKRLPNLMIYHTIGNHDNKMETTNNFDAKAPFWSTIAPEYYSYNIGGVHYIVFDNIDCSGYDGTTSRNYTSHLMPEQFTWLAKDLAYVDKSTPIIVTMHAPMFYPDGAADEFKSGLNNANDVLNAFEGYTVHFITGHTHKSHNVRPSDKIIKGRPIYEHNVTAVCGSWWWSGHYTPDVHLSPDGSPGGYEIWDINGKDIKWIYKGTKMDQNIQFRSYDLNNISFSSADVPNMSPNAPSSVKGSWLRYEYAYPKSQKNTILVNVWNWSNDWKISIKTVDGKELEVKEGWAYDPLHIAAMSVPRFNDANLTSVPNFITQSFPHFFRATAPDADTDVIITVTDEFGEVYTETMERPKAFSTDLYRRK